MDLRKFNQITRPISYPLPLIDDILAQLGNSNFFTLKSGYWQVLMDSNKTAFSCHRGLIQLNVMAFGLCNAPSIFMELMNVALAECEDFCTAYLDDILLFSRSKGGTS